MTPLALGTSEPGAESGDENSTAPPSLPLQKLPFPPVKKSHILHCSYHFWHPLYRVNTPKARLIPLTDTFLNYLRADGIILPPDTDDNSYSGPADDDSGVFSESEYSDSDDEDVDPSLEWLEIHRQIRDTIAELGGKVTPKLNWSAPKDASWISATNDLQCQTANDVYLLLKSSDFVTHDLEQVYDDCVEDEEDGITSNLKDQNTPGGSSTITSTVSSQSQIPYHLILRKYFQLNPSLEFRCFVRSRNLLCICQRDLNHFEFLFPLRDTLRNRIQDFFDAKLKMTFPDENFVFDVYIPPPHEKVWLIDINPWAPRTDPLSFSWMEILGMTDPEPSSDFQSTVRLSLQNNDNKSSTSNSATFDPESDSDTASDTSDTIDTIEPLPFVPEFRLVERDDPEAYSFSTPQYSAHKLPREVVDASQAGQGGMRELLGQWQDVLARKVKEDEEYEEGEENDDDPGSESGTTTAAV